MSVRAAYVFYVWVTKPQVIFPLPLLPPPLIILLRPPLLKTNNPVTLAIISPKPLCNITSDRIIREMCNYQKTIIILEGNVTSNCPNFDFKIFVPKGVRSNKILILKKSLKITEGPQIFMYGAKFISMRAFFYGTELYHPATFLTWIIKKHRFSLNSLEWT